MGLGGTVGGLGWWGGVKHLVGLWGPGGLTGLLGLIGDSSERRSALVEVSMLPFKCRSTAEKINISNRTFLRTSLKKTYLQPTVNAKVS